MKRAPREEWPFRRINGNALSERNTSYERHQKTAVLIPFPERNRRGCAAILKRPRYGRLGRQTSVLFPADRSGIRRGVLHVPHEPMCWDAFLLGTAVKSACLSSRTLAQSSTRRCVTDEPAWFLPLWWQKEIQDPTGSASEIIHWFIILFWASVTRRLIQSKLDFRLDFLHWLAVFRPDRLFHSSPSPFRLTVTKHLLLFFHVHILLAAAMCLAYTWAIRAICERWSAHKRKRIHSRRTLLAPGGKYDTRKFVHSSTVSTLSGSGSTAYYGNTGREAGIHLGWAIKAPCIYTHTYRRFCGTDPPHQHVFGRWKETHADMRRQ